jgi:hypothetical protein
MCTGPGLQTLYGNVLNDFKTAPTQSKIKNEIIEATNNILAEQGSLPEGMLYNSVTILNIKFLSKEAFEQFKDKKQ